MMRSLLLLLALSAAWLTLSGMSTSPAHELVAQLPMACSDGSCKPLGPVEIQLAQVGGAEGGQVQLSFTLTPRRDLLSLDWEWRLPGDVVPLDGDLTGKSEGAAGVPSEGTLRVDVPTDGDYHKLVLAARGVFEASDGAEATWAEPFEVTAALRWGQPRPDAPTVTRVGPRGESESVVVLPSTWHEGR